MVPLKNKHPKKLIHRNSLHGHVSPEILTCAAHPDCCGAIRIPPWLIFWRYPGRPADRNEANYSAHQERRAATTDTHSSRGWLGGRDGRGGEGGVKEQTETKSVYNIQCVMSALRNSPTSPRVVIITTWQQLNEQISYSPLYLSLALWSPPLCSLT